MKKRINLARGAICILIFLITLSCTFDYGETESSESDLPDLVMINVEYIRVRSADPIARVYAERAERYEKKGVMKLENFTFEQYGEKGNEVNTTGNAGNASVDINSGDIQMTNGVRLEVESEDIIIETNQLDWKDETHILSTGNEDEVNIYRENGTHFTGIGLTADARKRTFEFSSDVSGSYIQEDDEAEEADKAEEANKTDETNKTEKQEETGDE
ncbi:LPS export ABC transporter periplasmic protein LptC [Treponema sp. R80B11-R83G3]